MRRLLALIALLFAVPLAAQDALPPAPYANVQLADPAQEAKAHALMLTLRCLKCLVALGGLLALFGRLASDLKRLVARDKIAYRRTRQGR